jgi:hypothetical protein
MWSTTPWLSLLYLVMLTGCAGGGSGDNASTSPVTASVDIAWDPTESIGGYYVHYGPESPNVVGSCGYAHHVYYSVGSLASASSPTATISGLTPGRTYYFAVSAHGDSLESACSNEISRAM